MKTSASLVALSCLAALTVSASTPNLVRDPGFETSPAPTLWPPSSYSVNWAGDPCQIVGTASGVSPRSGSKMLQYLACSPLGADFSMGSEVWQLIDLTDYADLIASGRAVVSAEAYENRVPGDSQTDSSMGLVVDTHDGDPTDFFWDLNTYTARAARGLLTDSDPLTWEHVSTDPMLIPPGTTFLALRISASENVYNDSSSPELDGHFTDDVAVYIDVLPALSIEGAPGEYGAPATLGYGQHLLGIDDIIGSMTNAVSSPVSLGYGSRALCTGWTGTGDVPASGTETQVVFQIMNTSTLTWHWATEYLLELDAVGGTIEGADEGWFASNTPLRLTAIAAAGSIFDYWTVNGASAGTTPTLDVTMAGPRQVVAHFLGDRDEDGLSDADEVNVYGTNPDKPDTDGDLLSDGDEVLIHATDPRESDSDGDGLKDGREINELGTDPRDVDSDGDGIDDGSEVEAGMNPLAAVPGLDLLLQSAQKGMMTVAALSSKGLPWKRSAAYGPASLWSAVGFELDEVLVQSKPGLSAIFARLDHGSIVPTTAAFRGLRGWQLCGFEGRRVLMKHADGAVKFATLRSDGTLGSSVSISGISTSMAMRGFYGNRILAQQGDGGMIRVYTVNEAGQVVRSQQVVSALSGWRAIDLVGNFIVLYAPAASQCRMLLVGDDATPRTWFDAFGIGGSEQPVAADLGARLVE